MLRITLFLLLFYCLSYGDVVPKTIPGRTIMFIWALYGLFMLAAITATVTDSATSNMDIKIGNQKVSLRVLIIRCTVVVYLEAIYHIDDVIYGMWHQPKH